MSGARRGRLVVETGRLALRRMATGDAAFILRLLNEPSFLHFIGDKGVRTLDDARKYIETGPVDSYRRLGFGLYLVVLQESGASIGMCGLLKRESLEDVDVGFAFLPEFWSRGYALEAASAVVAHGRDALGLSRILAVTTSDNTASIRLLEKLGLAFSRMVRLSEDEAELELFAADI